jgi:hypothetical protein
MSISRIGPPPVVRNDATAAIASGQTVSGAIDLKGLSLVGVHLPASFTGTTLTFQAAETLAGSFGAVYKDGADLSVAVAAGKYVVLNPADFAGVRFLKVVSGSAEGAARTLTLAIRPV